MTNIDYSTFAAKDAAFVARLIDNGEWERALRHAHLLVGSIEMTMKQNGITPTPVHIHDSTAA